MAKPAGFAAAKVAGFAARFGEERSMVGTVASLVRYPVKGCAGIELSSAELTSEGIAGDRRFMLVSTSDGAFLSQRTHSGLAVLHPRLDGGVLTVMASDAPPLRVDVLADGPRRKVSLFDKWFGEGVDQGDDAAAWFTERIGVDCRLVRTPPGMARPGWGDTPGWTGFADAHALLVCSLSSLDDLNARMVANGGKALPVNRFRPNIVVSGWPEPYIEDLVREMRIGASARLAHSARGIRCAVPTVDQATGRKDGHEPTKTLSTYRREPEMGGGVSFGVKCAVTAPALIRVGDPVEVLDRLPENYRATQ